MNIPEEHKTGCLQSFWTLKAARNQLPGYYRLLHSIPESAPRVSLQNMMNILGFDGD